jgi:hypothetical protein
MNGSRCAKFGNGNIGFYAGGHKRVPVAGVCGQAARTVLCGGAGRRGNRDAGTGTLWKLVRKLHSSDCEAALPERAAPSQGPLAPSDRLDGLY